MPRNFSEYKTKRDISIVPISWRRERTSAIPHPHLPVVPTNGKMVFLIKVVLDPQICGFCGSNTVPPDNRCYDRSGLQSGALPSELKPRMGNFMLVKINLRLYTLAKSVALSLDRFGSSCVDRCATMPVLSIATNDEGKANRIMKIQNLGDK